MHDKTLVIGDMHLSDTFRGTHINYTESCRRLMRHVVDLVKKESPKNLIFAGDFLGVNDKNVRSRSFYLEILQFLKELNSILNGNVFIVKGNHDVDGYSVTDTEMFIEIGFLKHPKYIDLHSEDGKAMARVHLVDYSFEDYSLDMLDGKNIVVGHNDFNFGSQGTFGGIDLNTHDVWEGVDLVLSGHIHIPTVELKEGHIGEMPSSLFILGAPSRVAERIPDVFYMVLGTEKNEFAKPFEDDVDVTFEAKLFGLWSVEEEFIHKNEGMTDEEIEDERQSILRISRLKDLIHELTTNKLMRGTLRSQVEKFPGVSEEVRSLAQKYLEQGKATRR